MIKVEEIPDPDYHGVRILDDQKKVSIELGMPETILVIKELTRIFKKNFKSISLNHRLGG